MSYLELSNSFEILHKCLKVFGPLFGKDSTKLSNIVNLTVISFLGTEFVHFVCTEIVGNRCMHKKHSLCILSKYLKVV